MSNPDDQKELDINFMPFSINYNGPAPISKYVKVSESNGKLTSHFRGREIKGQAIALPDTLSGVLVSKPQPADTSVHILGSFREVKLWEHDLEPNTALVTDLFDWVEIAQAVCIKCIFVRAIVRASIAIVIVMNILEIALVLLSNRNLFSGK
jgi:hypothetical protein